MISKRAFLGGAGALICVAVSASPRPRAGAGDLHGPA